MNFVCVDGGGTKLNAIWFDENMRELGTARAKGINSTISPKAECQKQMRECFLNLFGDKMPKVLDKLYVTFGNGKEYAECLPEGLELREIVNFGRIKGCSFGRTRHGKRYCHCFRYRFGRALCE